MQSMEELWIPFENQWTEDDESKSQPVCDKLYLLLSFIPVSRALFSSRLASAKM